MSNNSQYIISKGKKYLKIIGKNKSKYIFVSGVKNATKFPTESEATMFQQTRLTNSETKDSVITFVSANAPVTQSNVPNKSNEINDKPNEPLNNLKEVNLKDNSDTESIQEVTTIFDSNNFNWREYLTAFQAMLTQLPQYIDNLSKQLSKLDKKKVDIEHYIEFGNFNGYTGYLANKKLQDLLLERRKVKNELIIVKNIVNSNSKLTDFSNGRFIKALDGLEKRRYTPRVNTNEQVNEMNLPISV